MLIFLECYFSNTVRRWMFGLSCSQVIIFFCVHDGKAIISENCIAIVSEKLLVQL